MSGAVASQDVRPVALVTGARRGLGRGIAYSLAKVGHDLVLNDLVEDADAEETVAEAERLGARVVFLRHDIGDVHGHGKFVAQAVGAFGRLDCLVNNAGMQVPRRVGLLEVPPDEFDTVIAVNLRGTFFLTQEVARVMTATKHDGVYRSIITITSSNAGFASTDKGAYCLSKSALSMMNVLFALELGPHDVQVFEIRPGLMETEMTAKVREKYANFVENYTLFKRWGTPEDIGRVVASLAVGQMPYTSGEIINVDGGLHIRQL